MTNSKKIIQDLQNELDLVISETERKKSAKTKIDADDIGKLSIFSSISTDIMKMLSPVLEAIIEKTRITKEEMKEILQEVKIETPQIAPQVSVFPQVKVDTPKVPPVIVPEMKFPKEELINAIKEAVSKIKFPKIESPQVEIPKEMKIAKMEEFIQNLEKLGNAKLTAFQGINRDNPLPVILTDENGNFYKAIMQAITTGGGKGIGAVKMDSDGHLQVDVKSIAAGTNNIGDVDVLTLPSSVIAGMTSLPAGINNIGDVDVLTLPALSSGTNIIGKVDHAITTISDNRKTITTAGTRETLVASSTPCKKIIITAETDNTGIIVVGGSTVGAALATRRGTPLYAGDSIEIEIDDLVDIYLDTTVSGDGVTYTYFN